MDRITLSIVFLFVGVLSTLFVTKPKPSKDETHEMAKAMKCNIEQITEAKKYFEVCKESGYFDTHCWDLAVVNSCEKDESNHQPQSDR